MFLGCTSLVGGEDMRYDESKTDATYANPGKDGYFTKLSTGIKDVEYDEEKTNRQNGILYDISGRRLNQVPERGFYIQNGKVLFR